MDINAAAPIHPIQDMNTHPGPLGLTKRELFAGMAMQGSFGFEDRRSYEEMAQRCVNMADALLAELAKD